VQKPEDPVLRGTETRLFNEYADALLPFVPRRYATKDAVFTWDRGFIRAAKLDSYDFDIGDSAVEKLVRHPSARFLRELEVRAFAHAFVVPMLVDNPSVPLRVLRLSDVRNEHHAADGDLCAQFPELEVLAIANTPVELRTLGAKLRRLELQQAYLPEATAAALRVAPLPALESLTIAFDLVTDHDRNVAMLDAFFLRTDLRALRHLRFHSARGTALVDMLVRAPFAEQLESVGVHSTGFTVEASQRLNAAFGDRLVT
jgi:hypothetical protein